MRPTKHCFARISLWSGAASFKSLREDATSDVGGVGMEASLGRRGVGSCNIDGGTSTQEGGVPMAVPPMGETWADSGRDFGIRASEARQGLSVGAEAHGWGRQSA